jgi:hypothetical protein
VVPGLLIGLLTGAPSTSQAGYLDLPSAIAICRKLSALYPAAAFDETDGLGVPRLAALLEARVDDAASGSCAAASSPVSCMTSVVLARLQSMVREAIRGQCEKPV